MFLYSLKSGFKNLGNNKFFTIASIGTIACCVFIFSIFYIFAKNIDHMINRVEETVGIQVFFDEDLDETMIKTLGEQYFITEDVKKITYISSEDAWNKVKNDYFEGRPELAEAFSDDNPLAKSSSFEILLYDINDQKRYVDYISTIPGVRQVNYSNFVIDALVDLNKFVKWFSFIIIIILTIIATILISNTIIIASEHRKEENEIMKLIGATNFMVRTPFVLEGIIIGFLGAIIPLIFIVIFYQFGITIMLNKMEIFLSLFEPLPILKVFPTMAMQAILFSIIISGFVSFVTIRKHLSV